MYFMSCNLINPCIALLHSVDLMGISHYMMTLWEYALNYYNDSDVLGVVLMFKFSTLIKSCAIFSSAAKTYSYSNRFSYENPGSCARSTS